MTLRDAITDLSIQREVKRRLGKNHEAESIGLGIEALKRVQGLRPNKYGTPDPLLPGETYIPDSIGKLPSDDDAEQS